LITAKTVAKLARLALWQPPPGVERLHVVWDDGTIAIHLESERFQESVSVCPCCSADGVSQMLDEIAAGLLEMERREANQAGRKAEARVERQLASADRAFRAGLKRATGKGD
jgi:CRP-like cAMP-binding protein